MAGRKRSFTQEQLEEAVAASIHMQELAQTMGYCNGYSYLRKYIEEYNIDTSHWKKRSKRFYEREPKPFNTLTSNKAIRLRLYELRGNCCELCGIDSWLDKPLVIQLHHIDGDRKHNTLENLQLLCPNCHTQTENYGNKRRH